MNLLIATGGVTDLPELSSFISPNFFTSVVNNGSYTSPAFRVTVNNAKGDVSYAWSFENDFDNANVRIIDFSEDAVKVNASSYDDTVRIRLKCIVTDDFDGSTSETGATLTLTFGR